MTGAVVIILTVPLLGLAVWKFIGVEWRSNAWRTRHSEAANNWKNEGYMASEDGHNWAEIDGTIADSAPSRAQSPGNLLF